MFQFEKDVVMGGLGGEGEQRREIVWGFARRIVTCGRNSVSNVSVSSTESSREHKWPHM